VLPTEYILTILVTVCGFLVIFVVTGGRSWRFKTLNFEVLEIKQEKLFV